MSHTLKHSLLYLACMSALYVSHESQAQDTSDANDVEVVQVLGIRSSLTGALDNKRSADSVVDSISAEDLGKFPDQNIAESLQRISGVFIDRQSGEGSKITVRGFGPEFNTVRLNNRTIATIETGEVDYFFSDVNLSRAFDFQALAAEVLSGADVVKSPTSDMWEGSLGASVNMRTARPLDSIGFHMSGSAQARYQDLGEEWGASIIWAC